MGMKIATTAVELMAAPKTAAPAMITINSRVSFPPPFLNIQSPIAAATPVRSSMSPTTNNAATRITTGLPKPDNASPVLCTPLNIKASTTRTATISKRTLLLAISTATTPIKVNTKIASPLITIAVVRIALMNVRFDHSKTTLPKRHRFYQHTMPGPETHPPANHHHLIPTLRLRPDHRAASAPVTRPPDAPAAPPSPPVSAANDLPHTAASPCAPDTAASRSSSHSPARSPSAPSPPASMMPVS